MTYEEAIAKLVEIDVAKWGEGERTAARRMRLQNCPTIGLALNSLAHADLDNIDQPLAAEARRLMTRKDKKLLALAAEDD